MLCRKGSGRTYYPFEQSTSLPVLVPGLTLFCESIQRTSYPRSVKESQVGTSALLCVASASCESEPDAESTSLSVAEAPRAFVRDDPGASRGRELCVNSV